MSTDLKLDMYREMCQSITRGNYRGVFCNAKPLFILSVIDFASFYDANQILFFDSTLNKLYSHYCTTLGNNLKTPLILPYYHLDSEPFYHLVWKGEIKPKTRSHTPSAKFLRTHLEYAKFDDELWDILQSKENRAYLKKSIVDYFFKN